MCGELIVINYVVADNPQMSVAQFNLFPTMAVP